tara:strand:- start:449 stop:1225 length:777 start_codon:yes stop_codon:yes gene_type:complete
MNYSKKDLEVLQEDLDKAVRDGMLEKDMVEKIIRGVKTGEYDLDKTREEIKESYELKETVTLIEKNLKITFPNMKFTSRLEYNDAGGYQLLEFYNNYGQMRTLSIKKDTIWSDFQRIIKKSLSCDIKKCEECPICCEDKYKGVNCNICGEKQCHACYINNFKTNHGKIICPFCRHTTHPPHDMDEFTYEVWYLEGLEELESRKKFMLRPKESEKKDPVLQAKLEEEARESFSVDITNKKVSHKSKKNKNKNKKKNRRK